MSVVVIHIVLSLEMATVFARASNARVNSEVMSVKVLLGSTGVV